MICKSQTHFIHSKYILNFISGSSQNRRQPYGKHQNSTTKISQKSKHCYFFKENEKDLQQKIKNNLPVYQVIETENENFNELLISPRMLQDHMPDNLIKCMKAVLEEPAPKKPPRQFDTK